MPKMYEPAYIPKLGVRGDLIDTLLGRDGITYYLIEDDIEYNTISDTKGIEVWDEYKWPIYVCREDEFTQD